MKEDFFKKFVQRATEENEQKLTAEKRKNHFKDLGRRGGLKKKSDPQLTRIISFRMTESEYQVEFEKAEKVKLKLSTFARMVYQGKVLKMTNLKPMKFCWNTEIILKGLKIYYATENGIFSQIKRKLLLKSKK